MQPTSSNDASEPTGHPQDPGEAVRPETLQRLAQAHGVRTRYNGFDGGEVEVPEATLRVVLTALGAEVTDESTARGSLERKLEEPWRQFLPPVIVTTEGQPRQVPVHVAPETEVEVRIVVNGESRLLSAADKDSQTRSVDGVLVERRFFDLPTDLPPEWYVLSASARAGAGRTGEPAPARPGTPGAAGVESVESRTAEIEVAVTPDRLTTTDRLLDSRRWGWAAQLYSIASDRSWGAGDINDLAALAAIGGEQGADYILVNPLHASEPVPPVEPSPYLPTTRRFFNPLYLRIADIPEYAYLRPSDLEVVSTVAAIQRRQVLDPDEIDRDATYAAKLKSLELLYTVRRSPQRQQQLERFVHEGGQHLQDFGLWCALREELGRDHELWDTDAATPQSPYAVEARERLRTRINFFVWIQWLLDEQLAEAQRAARSAGMEIGVMHDLAVGVTKDGADAWTLHEVMADGVSVGAPADMYNQQGQDWSQPPWHPQLLARAGYRPWREMLRTIFRHAGGIRVDHVIGLFRLWWIPEGNKASDGAYVYYDHEAMVGILALEAQRADVVVVGEDLGTVEPSAREFLSARGVLGTSVLWFEQEGDGPRDPRSYRQEAFASVGTHDLPPTAGFLENVQVDLRDRLGLLERPVRIERAEAEHKIETWLAAVEAAGLLRDGDGRNVRAADASEQEKIEGLYRYLALAPSILHCVQLVDAVGEKRVQNQPGTSDEYPNWQIPLADAEGQVVLIEDLQRSPRVASLARTMNEALGSTRRPHRGVAAPEQPRIMDSASPTTSWLTGSPQR